MATALLLLAVALASAQAAPPCAAEVGGVCPSEVDGDQASLLQRPSRKAAQLEARPPARPEGAAEPCPEGPPETVKAALLSENDGPAPYNLYQSPGAGGSANAAVMGAVFRQGMGIVGTRPDEAGKAFDIPCMFPVADLSNIPDPMDNANWDWEESDRYFRAIVANGLAPLLKVPVETWQSTRLTGLAYWDAAANRTVQKIPPEPMAGCKPWPSISGVINQVGPQLVKMIALRYNDPERFPVPGREGLGALDRGTFRRGFNGIELMNEWTTLGCFPDDSVFANSSAPPCPADGIVTAELYKLHCWADPYIWSSRYWDGSKEDAWRFYARAARMLREDKRTENIRVGGPAAGTSAGFFPCDSFEGVGGDWIEGFLNHTKREAAPLDFFSWHFYSPGQGQLGTRPLSYFRDKFRAALDGAGFASTTMAITEYNAPFVLSNLTHYVGSKIGAAMNAAKLVEEASWPDLEAAFVYTGRDGAFEPGNPYSFPLSCFNNWTSAKPQCRPRAADDLAGDRYPRGSLSKGDFKALPGQRLASDPAPWPGCRPADALIWNGSGYSPEGTWDDRCSTRVLDKDVNLLLPACAGSRCQFGPAPYSGMGNAYADGCLNPTGRMFAMAKGARGSPRLPLQEPYARELRRGGGYALAWEARAGRASLLLTNPFNQTSGSVSVSIRQLLGARACGPVVGSRELTQRTFEEKPRPVGTQAGFVSPVPLVGGTRAVWRQLTVRSPLPRLRAFQTVVVELRVSPRQHGE